MKLRDQQFKYRHLPDKTYLESLYTQYTLQQIADFHGTTKTRIRKWFDRLGIQKRVQGGGNHQIYHITREMLLAHIEAKRTVADIARIVGCRDTNITRAMQSFGITRYIRDSKQSEYQRYAGRVRRLSEIVFAANKEILNPSNLPRTLAGVPGGYQLDHIKGVRECFDDGVKEKQAADLSNLQFISWEENSKKRRVFRCRK